MTDQAARVVWRTLARLADYGVQLPGAIKARDMREPRLEEKMQFETQIIRIIAAHFKRQRKRIEDFLGVAFASRKATIKLPANLLGEDDETLSLLIRIFTKAALDGAALFADTVRPAIDMTAVNAEAVRVAVEQAGQLIKNIDATTLASVQKTIGNFVDTPGMTIGDVMDALPFVGSRQRTIAISAVTNIYGQVTQLAGEQLAKEFPGVEVVKMWFTNRDAIVCPVCGPMEGQTVGINEYFMGGDGSQYFQPGAHANCRCWTQTTTRITDNV